MEAKIGRMQRLLRMLEQEAPLLARRVSDLTPEHQQSAKSYVARLTAQVRMELETLQEQSSHWDHNDPTPQPAD
ncbi:MAG TPA: hypothetical protein VLW84_14620 [Terriglobales bacterium]|nr:hypothetical protein [Terriglobales bacterium]